MSAASVVVVMLGSAATVSAYACWLDPPTWSVTPSVKFDVPGVVGVPLSVPVDVFSVMPAGREPEMRLYTSGGDPVPLVVFDEYGTFTSADASDGFSPGGVLTKIVYGWDAVFESESVTVMRMLDEPV